MEKKTLEHPTSPEKDKKFLTEYEKDEIRKRIILAKEQLKRDRADKWKAKLQIQKEIVLGKEINCPEI